jgi:hypothetical protein
MFKIKCLKIRYKTIITTTMMEMMMMVMIVIDNIKSVWKMKIIKIKKRKNKKTDTKISNMKMKRQSIIRMMNHK